MCRPCAVLEEEIDTIREQSHDSLSLSLGRLARTFSGTRLARGIWIESVQSRVIDALLRGCTRAPGRGYTHIMRGHTVSL